MQLYVQFSVHYMYQQIPINNYASIVLFPKEELKTNYTTNYRNPSASKHPSSSTGTINQNYKA